MSNNTHVETINGPIRLRGNLILDGARIEGVSTPVDSTDIATKAYVDSRISVITSYTKSDQLNVFTYEAPPEYDILIDARIVGRSSTNQVVGWKVSGVFVQQNGDIVLHGEISKESLGDTDNIDIEFITNKLTIMCRIKGTNSSFDWKWRTSRNIVTLKSSGAKNTKPITNPP